MNTFRESEAALLADRDYPQVVLAQAENARRRIWASVFLYDLRPSRDVAGLVAQLTAALIQRKGLGVDVRVLVSAQVRTPDIAVANRATSLFLDHYGVPNRQFFAAPDSGRAGTHAKFAVFDDVAVVGSQNWTDDAFRLNTEDAVLLTGLVVDDLAGQFQRMWSSGRSVRP